MLFRCDILGPCLVKVIASPKGEAFILFIYLFITYFNFYSHVQMHIIVL